MACLQIVKVSFLNLVDIYKLTGWMEIDKPYVCKELQLTVLALTDDNISNIWFGAHQLGNFSCDVGELPLGHHPDWRDGENYGGEGFYR